MGGVVKHGSLRKTCKENQENTSKSCRNDWQKASFCSGLGHGCHSSFSCICHTRQKDFSSMPGWSPGLRMITLTSPSREKSQWHMTRATAYSRGGGCGFGSRIGSPIPHSQLIPRRFASGGEPCMSPCASFPGFRSSAIPTRNVKIAARYFEPNARKAAISCG